MKTLTTFVLLLILSVGLNGQDNPYAFMRAITQGYEDFSGAMAVQQNCPLYEWPDTGSAVLKKLDLYQAVEVLETGTDEKQKIHWYKVKTGEQKGYMRIEDLATQSIYNPDTKTRYFVLQPSPYMVRDSVRITVFDVQKNVFTDTIWENGISAESYFSLQLYSSGLKGVKNILGIRKIMPYCGGGTAESYYADTRSGLVHLFATFSGGDIGYVHEDMAWIPARSATGSIEMVLIGENIAANKKHTFPQTWKPNIPRQELVVVQSIETEYELDEEDMPIKNEAGNEKTNVTVNVVKYYRWDGILLKEIKVTHQ